MWVWPAGANKFAQVRTERQPAMAPSTALLLGLVATSQQADAAAPRAHIIQVVADDLG